MTLFDRIFRRARPIEPLPSPSIEHVRSAGPRDRFLLEGHETLEVVGESHYQDALWRLVGGNNGERVRYDVQAVLEPEPTNPYDANAVRVFVDAHLVGYLSREDAVVYLPGLRALIERFGCAIGLGGVIVGGGLRPDGPGMLGVFLDHDPADFGLRSNYVAHIGELRTGLSDALATDLDDDRYDLSWLHQLSGTHGPEDVLALRRLLVDERDPLDRHFMLSELSRSLYKCRDVLVSALDEFDEVCEQHQLEMGEIRPVLLEKFGGLPLVEMYRQSAIRCQKARDWKRVELWAERGLAFYGTQASRPEAVDDLAKRLAHAHAKIDAVAAGMTRPRSVASQSTASTSAIETLTCQECGSTFERARTRGRKPHLCPACRAAHPSADLSH